MYKGNKRGSWNTSACGHVTVALSTVASWVNTPSVTLRKDAGGAACPAELGALPAEAGEPGRPAEAGPGQATCSGFSVPHTMLPNLPRPQGFLNTGGSLLHDSVMLMVRAAAHRRGWYSRFFWIMFLQTYTSYFRLILVLQSGCKEVELPYVLYLASQLINILYPWRIC